MSSFLDSFAVCLGAVSALRAVVFAEGSMPSHPAVSVPCRQSWQQHGLSIASGLFTATYAIAGGSRDALIANVLIVTAGAVMPLCRDVQSQGAAR